MSEMVEIRSGSFEAHVIRSIALSQLGRLDEAMAALEMLPDRERAVPVRSGRRCAGAQPRRRRRRSRWTRAERGARHDPGSTYLDRAIAAVAAAGAHAAARDETAAVRRPRSRHRRGRSTSATSWRVALLLQAHVRIVGHRHTSSATATRSALGTGWLDVVAALTVDRNRRREPSDDRPDRRPVQPAAPRPQLHDRLGGGSAASGWSCSSTPATASWCRATLRAAVAGRAAPDVDGRRGAPRPRHRLRRRGAVGAVDGAVPRRAGRTPTGRDVVFSQRPLRRRARRVASAPRPSWSTPTASTVPISATQIREAPADHLDRLAPAGACVGGGEPRGADAARRAGRGRRSSSALLGLRAGCAGTA